MELFELFKRLPEDYAHRTVAGPDDRPHNKPKFDPRYSKIVGTFDNKDVWGSKEIKGYDIFGFRDGEKTIAYVILDEREVKPNTQEFKELWTDSNYRRKGLASGLILFLTTKCKTNLLLSPVELVSDDARDIFKVLGKSGKIKIEDQDGKLDTFDEILSAKMKTDYSLLIREDVIQKKVFGSKMFLENNQSTLAEPYSIGVMQDWSEFE
jgi:GNAT superfamily N-acetyltransferase